MTQHAVRQSSRLVIIDPDGRLLLFLYDDGILPAFWSTVGGEVTEGETYEITAARELHEETGFDAVIGPVIRTRDEVFAIGAAAPSRYLERYFLVPCRGGEPDRSRWTAEERATIRAHRWWSLADMRSTTDTFRPPWLPSLLEEALERLPPS